VVVQGLGPPESSISTTTDSFARQKIDYSQLSTARLAIHLARSPRRAIASGRLRPAAGCHRALAIG
jgi:hypothetical protein